jgi:hypothetical protein
MVKDVTSTNPIVTAHDTDPSAAGSSPTSSSWSLILNAAKRIDLRFLEKSGACGTGDQMIGETEKHDP